MMNPNDISRNFFIFQSEYENKALEVLRSGWYVLGKELEAFENEWAMYNGAKYAVGLASGLDALWLSMKALGIGVGDEVIVQGNTFIASVMGITINGAKPVFVEPDEHYSIDASKIEEKITDKTKAILVVHLYGIVADMDEIIKVCQKYDLLLIEDCAQSHGATYKGKMTGTFGNVGCFSFYPTKNLGCFGDGGAIITNREAVAKYVKMYRNYGSERRYYNKVVGANSRLDEIQAGLLRIKLLHMEELIQEREKIAERYLNEITNSKITLPYPRLAEGNRNVWHQFVIRTDSRDELRLFLEKKGIGTLIHYPVPPYLSEAYKNLGYQRGSFPITEKYADTVLSIPIFNGITYNEQNKVIQALNEF